MAMTPYSGDTSVIGKLGTTPQERGLTTQQFKDKFDEGLKNFVTWFNETHNGEINAHMADGAAHGGIYRKNLLINWDFRNPVNQRGLTSYSNHKHTIDRWKWTESNSGLITTLNSGYITLTNNAGYYGYWEQLLERTLEDGVYTISCITSDGTLYSKAVTVTGGSPSPGVYVGSHGYLYFTSTPTVVMRVAAGGSVSLKAIKLEIGSVSTLANDPPADYGEQLMLCKRFFRLWKTAEARTAALQEVGLMRLENPTLGTINIGGTTYYYASADL